MPKKVYIVLGNHRSFAGIKEIVYTVHSALTEQLSVELSRELKSNSVNIVIDEFSRPFDVFAIRKVTKLYPETKMVIVATEFATTVSIFGIEIIRTFNFFGSARDWSRLLLETLRSFTRRYDLPYMRLRYVGFAEALKYCDLLATIHPRIAPTVTELTKRVAPNLKAPLLIYPQIAPFSKEQQNQLWRRPAGLTMTGTLTPYRIRILHKLVRKFRRTGWSTPLFEHRSFEVDRSTASSDRPSQSETLTSLLKYNSADPKFLFNINPPQSAKWEFSSPMRILRAILLGQIPVITKRFHDHQLENVAALWDGTLETAIELAARQSPLVDRQMWVTDYIRSIETYDREAKTANRPFVNAIRALAESSASHTSTSLVKEP